MGANSEDIQSLKTNVNSWSTWLDLFICLMFLISPFAGTVTSIGAWFNDSRCLAGGVTQLIITLFSSLVSLRKLSLFEYSAPHSGHQEVAPFPETANDIRLSTGFTVVREVNDNIGTFL